MMKIIRFLILPLAISFGLSIMITGLLALALSVSFWWTLLVALLTTIMVSFVLYIVLLKPMKSYIDYFADRCNDEATAEVDNKLINNSTFGKQYAQLISTFENFNNIVGSISGNGSEVAIASATVSFAADQLKNQMHKEVEWVSDIRQSAEHIKSIVSESGDTTKSASQSAVETYKASQEGLKEIKQAVQQMQDINIQAAETSKYVKSLAEKSEQIQQITSVISGIAGQTNLLALNAAIEAARAGEQGRGFAVVADEVRNLAHKTTEATEQIGSMVSEIGDSVHHAESTMSKLNSSIEEGASKTNDIGEQLELISSLAKNMQQQVGGIVYGIEENISKVGDISASIEKVTHQLQDTEGQVTEVSEEATGLSQLAEKILSITLGFDRYSVHGKIHLNASKAAAEISTLFENAIKNGTITQSNLFDQNYIPIKDTDPLKHSTKFDQFTDSVLPAIQEPLLINQSEIAYAGAVDFNGYFPTHNNKFCQPLTGDYEKDLVNNRTKRIFSDACGSRCGAHTEPFLLQTYKRDTGEIMHDLSIPIYVNGKHWGGFRIGYQAS